MVLEQTEKSKYVQVNDKRYYFSDGIVSLPFSHSFLHEINQLKKDKNKKIKLFVRTTRQAFTHEKKCRSKKSKAFTLQIHFATKSCNLSP